MKVAAKESKKYRAMKSEWLDAVNQLVVQIEGWAKKQGWASHRGTLSISEPGLGTYEVPMLTVEIPGGEVYVKPIARVVGGGDGRVDIQAFPTLSRVKLLRKADEWVIITDSNVRLRADWTQELFADLACEMVA